MYIILIYSFTICPYRLVHSGDGRVKRELLPEDESDSVPNRVIYMLMIIAVLEGFMFALFSSVVAGM